MTSAFASLLGVGLVGLWVAGITIGASAWLTWLDLVAAVSAFLIAYAESPRGKIAERDIFRAAAPFALGMALLVYCIVGLSTRTTAWLSWWNGAFAMAFAITGLSNFRRVDVVRGGFGAAGDYEVSVKHPLEAALRADETADQAA